jgi:hypothetical protein
MQDLRLLRSRTQASPAATKKYATSAGRHWQFEIRDYHEVYESVALRHHTARRFFTYRP